MTVSNVIPFRACEAFPDLERRNWFVDEALLTRMDLLRRYAQESLLHSRAELDHACRVIAVDRSVTLRRHALALFGTLSEYAYRRMHFYKPGTPELSDSELWLNRVLDAYRDMDTAEGRALIAWRIRPLGHRRVRFLVGGLADVILELDVQVS